MNTLGVMYLEGDGVQQDFNKAYQLFHDSAQEKFAKAMCNVGDMYMYGLGRPVDASKAAMWYQRAVENGFQHADEKLHKARQEIKMDEDHLPKIKKLEEGLETEGFTARERIKRAIESKMPSQGTQDV